MKEFKDLLPYSKALERMLSNSLELGVEKTDLENAIGRVLSDDVSSPIDSPPFDRAAMDGYAIRAEDSFGVREDHPIELRVVDDITAGQVSSETVSPGSAVGIMTGAKMPKGADCVIMQEFTSRNGDALKILSKVPPNKNVSLRGEDTHLGDKVLLQGTMLSARHLAYVRSLGVENVTVKARPKVSIIVTGDEFILAKAPEEGKIFESNSLMLSKLLDAIGCEVPSVSVVPDDEAMIQEAIESASEKSDMLLITGGSSFGKKDMAHKLFDNFVFHGVTIKPGRPFGFTLRGEMPCFIMSGYPVASYVQFYLFVIPFIESALSTSILKRAFLPIDVERPSSLGRMEFVRCRIMAGNVEPIRSSGSSMISSLAIADGYILIDELTEGINPGDMIEFTYFL